MGQAQVTKCLTRSTSSIQPFPRLKKKRLCKETNTKTFAANGVFQRGINRKGTHRSPSMHKAKLPPPPSASMSFKHK